jgi:ceramide glucosyltransferase
MNVFSLVSILATAWCGLTLAIHGIVMIAVFVHPALRRRAATRSDQPAVSIVIPVRNMEPEIEEAFASVFSQLYPQFEVIIAAAEEASPAIDVARRVASRFPHIASRFMLGNKRFTLNPKVSNVAPAIAAAEHDLILIKDANIRLADGQLSDLVRELAAGTGIVCALPIGVRPETFFAEVECAMINGRATPFFMAGSMLHLAIGWGKVMLFDRRDYNRVGGVEVMAPTFGDDHALVRALAGIGLRVVYSAGVVRQLVGRRTLREVWDRQLRWMVIRRDYAALAFFAEPFFSAGFATLAGAAAGSTLGIVWWKAAAATLGFWLMSETIVVAARGWSWSWRFPLIGICCELLIIGLWARAWSARKVLWAGESFDVDGGPPRASVAATRN